MAKEAHFQHDALRPPEALCVKCHRKTTVMGGKIVRMKNGRTALKGACATCGTVLFRILGGKAGP